MGQTEHEYFMDEALTVAKQSAQVGEVPVGAVVVRSGDIIARGANARESRQDPLAHAELIAITMAAQRLGTWRLTDTVIYVTLEPCPMCAGAIVNARIPIVVFGAADPKAGAVRSLYHLLEDPRLNHRCQVIPDVRANESAALLSRFFAGLRAT